MRWASISRPILTCDKLVEATGLLLARPYAAREEWARWRPYLQITLVADPGFGPKPRLSKLVTLVGSGPPQPNINDLQGPTHVGPFCVRRMSEMTLAERREIISSSSLIAPWKWHKRAWHPQRTSVSSVRLVRLQAVTGPYAMGGRYWRRQFPCRRARIAPCRRA